MKLLDSDQYKTRNGITLIEVAVSVALFSGIMLLVLLFGWDIANFSAYFQEDLSVKQEIQLAMNTMLTELRSATLSENGSYPILTASPTSVSFYVDANGDGAIDQIRYFISTSTLEKGIIQPTSSPAQYPTSSEIVNTVTANVTTGTFSYFDAGYTGVESALTSTVDVSLIRVITFRMTVDQMTSTRPGPVSSSITATIRNLRSN